MRRRRKTESGGSLDSLLDTMTNVVGILVIVLAVTQLGVSDAVNRIRGLDIDVLDVTPEVLEAAKKEAQKLQQMLEEFRAKADDSAEQSFDQLVTLQRIRAAIEELQKAREHRQKAAALDRKKIERQVEQYRQEVKKLQQQYVEREQELERLKGILQQTPEPPGPPPKFVYLPNPRPAPKGAKPVLFICKNGRVAPFDLDELRKEAEKAGRFAAGLRTPKARRGTTIRKGRPAQGKPEQEEKRVVDCEKVVAHFKRRIVGDRHWRIKLRMEKGKLFMLFEPGREKGETADRLKRPRSRFERFVRALDKEKFYGRFLVWSDSFDTYLEARRIAQEAGLLAGWVPYDANYQYKVELKLPIVCKGFEPAKKPPAPKPVVKPKPAVQPVKPPVPKPPPPRDEID